MGLQIFRVRSSIRADPSKFLPCFTLICICSMLHLYHLRIRRKLRIFAIPTHKELIRIERMPSLLCSAGNIRGMPRHVPLLDGAGSRHEQQGASLGYIQRAVQNQDDACGRADLRTRCGPTWERNAPKSQLVIPSFLLDFANVFQTILEI